MPEFIPGITLSRLFYQREVKPILDKDFPRLCYSAALLGWGSEVLRFDTAISRDHHWGPRVLLFLKNTDYSTLKGKISQTLSNNLPTTFMGYSTNYSRPEKNGVRLPVKIKRGPVNHMINIYTAKSFFEARLGFDPSKKITATDWLMFPQQRLLEVVSGEVFHDGLGELTKVRKRLKFYPRDVWLYLLAAQWTRISQEEAFVGRAGELGDELGSQLVAAQLVRELIKLSFLLEKRYTPYSKWLGSAFNQLKIAGELKPALQGVLSAKTWRVREKRLATAYSLVAEAHNSLRITKPLETRATKYYSRPYRVIHGDNFATALKRAIKDPEVKRIKTDIGSVDQFTDSTDVTQNLSLIKRLKAAYSA